MLESGQEMILKCHGWRGGIPLGQPKLSHQELGERVGVSSAAARRLSCEAGPLSAARIQRRKGRWLRKICQLDPSFPLSQLGAPGTASVWWLAGRVPRLSRPVGECQNSREDAGLPLVWDTGSHGWGVFARHGCLGPWWPPFARQPEPRGFEGQWAWSGSLTSRRQRAACLEPRTRGARGGGEARPGPWGRLAARPRVFPRGALPSPPRGGGSLLARLCCRLAGGPEGSKARPDWALPALTLARLLNGLRPREGHLH